MVQNRRIVYSTDPKDLAQKCKSCGSFQSECNCLQQEDANRTYTVNFRLEKSGRGGKIVTVMDGWPRNEEFLRSMAKELKVKCGVGGTHILDQKNAVIEIQGDQRIILKKILDTKGIRYKGH